MPALASTAAWSRLSLSPRPLPRGRRPTRPPLGHPGQFQGEVAVGAGARSRGEPHGMRASLAAAATEGGPAHLAAGAAQD